MDKVSDEKTLLTYWVRTTGLICGLWVHQGSQVSLPLDEAIPYLERGILEKLYDHGSGAKS